MGRRIRSIILLTPISLLYMVLIGGGFFMVFKESLGYIPNLGFNKVTWQYYQEALTQNDFLSSMIISLVIAGISASLSMCLGAIIAYKMVRSQSKTLVSWTSAILRFGIIMPYLYMVFLVMLFFSHSGMISRLLHVFFNHQPGDFPNLIYGMGGVILVFALKGIPFVTLLTMNVMSNINSDLEHVALTLGSQPSDLFRKIYLPLSRDTIVWTGLVLFAYDLGSFEVPYILSQLNSQSFSVKLYSEYLKPDIEAIPVTMAMTVILFVVGLISVSLYALISRYLIRRLQ